MDVGAGHFARLEVATDNQISIPFAKEIAVLARTAVRRAKNTPSRPADKSFNTNAELLAQSPQPASKATPDHFWIDNYDTTKDVSSSKNVSICAALLLQLWTDPHLNHKSPPVNFFDLELEHWSALLPINDFDDAMSDFLV